MTDRDMAMLQAVAQFRFLSSDQLHRFVGGSARGVRNRLLLMAALDYIVRVAGLVTEPFAYGLANRGARLLADRGHAINQRLDWASKNDRTDYFLAHTLAIADAMLQFRSAARGRAIHLIDHQALLPDMPRARAITVIPSAYACASSTMTRV